MKEKETSRHTNLTCEYDYKEILANSKPNLTICKIIFKQGLYLWPPPYHLPVARGWLSSYSWQAFGNKLSPKSNNIQNPHASQLP